MRIKNHNVQCAIHVSFIISKEYHWYVCILIIMLNFHNYNNMYVVNFLNFQRTRVHLGAHGLRWLNTFVYKPQSQIIK